MNNSITNNDNKFGQVFHEEYAVYLHTIFFRNIVKVRYIKI